MPKNVSDQSNEGKSKPTSPKKKFSQTEANPPMTDFADWRKRILEGTKEERIAAINEAAEKKSVDAVPILIEAALYDEDVIQPSAANALGDIELDDEQFEIIIKAFYTDDINEDVCTREQAADVLGCIGNIKAVSILFEAVKSDDEELWFDVCKGIRSFAIRNPGNPSVMEFIPHILKMLRAEGEDCRSGALSPIKAIVRQNQNHPKIRKAVLPLINALNDAYYNVVLESIEILGDLGDKRAVPALSKLLNDERYRTEAIEALKKIGLTEEQIEKAEEEEVQISLGERRERIEDISEYLHDPHQKAVYTLLTENRDIKRIVFENAEILELLLDQQAWITINDPKLVKDVLELMLEKLGRKRSSLENVLRSSLGVRVKQLEDAHFTYYADEILDAVSQVVRNSRLMNDEELNALLSQVKFGNGGVCLRYVRREMADLSLGDKCGDCTAKGGVNFGNSVSWLVNPAYQILKMSNGKRFIGKINFTLGTLAGRDAVIIDALEFNPQAQKGKPYYEDGLECLDVALSFLRGLARAEQRKLFALRVSNSSGAVEILEEHGRQIITGETWKEYVHSETDHSDSVVPLSLITSAEDVTKILATIGHEGNVNLFYQMLDSLVEIDTNEDRKNLTDEKLPILEREVINPAQIANPEVATAMRERDFGKASSQILADSELEGKVKGIYGLPMEHGVSPKFLSTRLEKIYKAVAMDAESLKRTFMVDADEFVRL